MGGQEPKKEKKHICVGLLAHVDAGKTTLSEQLLYESGMIRTPGRVDKQSAYLDTNMMERERGITIFSKQAILKLPEVIITLLDTPGHVDFSAEMERTLQVLDYAVLVISGADGVQGHTRTLWRLLDEYHIPVFLFINKMDQSGTDRERLMADLKQQLSDCCIAFDDTRTKVFMEEAAMCSEDALNIFLETETISTDLLCGMIAARQIFPCYFGAALKEEGVKEFLHGISTFMLPKEYPDQFGAKVYKIMRDSAGSRLTCLKITGGSLKVKDLLYHEEGGWEEKVNQIRIYSGEKYEPVNEVKAGEVCAVTGLSQTYPGQGLGIEGASFAPLLEPILTYCACLPDGLDAVQILPKFKEIEEEDPMLHVLWNEVHQEILVQVMGEVQTDVLKRQLLDRFGIEIGFGSRRIVYKETIADTVEGVGHFEPLRHYAEVHLLLSPGRRGSGVVTVSECSEDILDKNWQRLILTHLREREHAGVLTGSSITDIRITLVAGRAHQKHTEGGDFRQATYRAVRQGLMQAECVLLEPYYEYRLEVPEAFTGRAMTDMKQRHGSMDGPDIKNGFAVLTGAAPVALLQEYAREVAAYTKGNGRLFLSYGGYDICHNSEEVIVSAGYDPQADLLNPAGSVFCSHGAGQLVEWYRVKEFMHVESVLSAKKDVEKDRPAVTAQSICREEAWLDTEEVDAILEKTFHANKKGRQTLKKGYKAARRVVASDGAETPYRASKKEGPKEEYLLVDGYNIIYAWEHLRKLSETNMDGARGVLLDTLCNYQGMKNCQVIAVFDAYRVAGHKTEVYDYHNIHVVYTREAETADAYIEKFAHENSRKYHVTVATSDGLEQIIIRGAGCLLMSAREFAEEISRMKEQLKEVGLASQRGGRSYLLDGIKEDVEKQIKAICGESEGTE